MRGLELLVPDLTATRDSRRWATVTQASPLRVKLDGESTALGFTPDTLVSNLAVDDRVRVEVVGRRLTVVGRSGGQAIADGDVDTDQLAADAVTNAKLANMSANTIKGRVTASTGDPEDLTGTQANEILQLPNVVCDRIVPGTINTTSTSYSDITGASISFTKRHADTDLVLQVSGTWFFIGSGGGDIALRVDGTDYTLVHWPGTVVTATRQGFAGADTVSGLAADTYTVQARWRAVVSGQSVDMSSGSDQVCITVMETWA